MRKASFFFSIFLLAFASNGFAQKGYTITGTLAGAPDSTIVYLKKDMISDNFPLDSTLVIDQQFRFKGTVPFPMECALYLDEESSDVLHFWIENSNITINGTSSNLEQATVQGSKANKLYEPYITEVIRVRETLGAGYYSDTAKALTKQFILKHPDSYKSAQELYLFREMISEEEEKELYSSLTQEIKNSRQGKFVSLHITNRKDLQIGSIAPAFTLPTAEGKSVSLSSFRGKTVVLIFWGSWCAPCRVANVDYNKLYEQYKSNEVVFLGIALDKKQDMLKAAKEDKVKWQNVLIPQQYDDPILFQYGVMGVPHNVVIDKNGKVVEMDLHPYGRSNDKYGKEHPSLDTVLQTILSSSKSNTKGIF